MNKEQLINLKKLLEQGKKKYSVAYMKNSRLTNEEEIIYSLNSLQELPSSKSAVETLTDNFEKLIRFLTINNIDYDEISIIPNFGILVKQEDLDLDEEIIKETAEILYDKALLDFYEISIKKDGIEIPEINIPKDLEKRFTKFFYITISNFIIDLLNEGLELEEINNFEDIKNNSKGKITINFSKNKKNLL